jgi:hypothetical protein
MVFLFDVPVFADGNEKPPDTRGHGVPAAHHVIF